jgi:hypothetical protein
MVATYMVSQTAMCIRWILLDLATGRLTLFDGLSDEGVGQIFGAASMGFGQNGIVYRGDSTGNVKSGTNRDDILYGFDDNDKIVGKNGNDLLFGGDGDDRLWGDVGNDVGIGGAGADDYIFDDSWGRDVVKRFESGVDDINLRLVDGLSSMQQLTKTHNADGDAVATFRQASITFDGLRWADLDGRDFLL